MAVFWVALPALLAGASWWLDGKNGWGFVAGPTLYAFGILLTAASAALLALAIRQYRRGAGEMPISAFPSAELVQVGLYGIWRHPIYLFYTICAIGLGLAAGSGGFFAIVLPILLLAELAYIAAEERLLVRRFGPMALGYRERTALVLPRLPHLLRPALWPAARLFCDFRVVHAERIPRSGPLIVVAAHRCYLDPVFLSLSFPHPIRFVTTFEMFRSSMQAWFFRRLFCLQRRRYRSDPAAGRAIRRSIETGWTVGLFLEGERSWDGSLQPLKPAALELLQSLGSVPVLPIRIEGNNLFWPRWRDFARSAPVRVIIEQPLFIRPDDQLEEIKSTLSELIRPDDSGLRCEAPDRASGIGRVLYRCPACKQRLPLLLEARENFSCPYCRTAFQLTPEHRLHYEREGRAYDLQLAEVYNAVRLSEQDVSRAEPIANADEATAEQHVLAHAEGVVMFEAQNTKLLTKGQVALSLTPERLLLIGNGLQEQIALRKITSVTTERNCDLQLYLAREKRLLQLRFTNDSALYWQDLLVLAVKREKGYAPNRN